SVQLDSDRVGDFAPAKIGQHLAANAEGGIEVAGGCPGLVQGRERGQGDGCQDSQNGGALAPGPPGTTFDVNTGAVPVLCSVPMTPTLCLHDRVAFWRA